MDWMWQGERKEASSVQQINLQDHNQPVRNWSGAQEEIWSEEPDWELLTLKKFLISGSDWFAQFVGKRKLATIKNLVTIGTLGNTSI